MWTVDKSQSLKESLEEMVPLVVGGHSAMFEGVSSIHTLQDHQDCKINDSGFCVKQGGLCLHTAEEIPVH